MENTGLRKFTALSLNHKQLTFRTLAASGTKVIEKN